MTYPTKENLNKIEKYLICKSKKDTDFPETYYLRGDESIPIVQRGLNRRLHIRKFINEAEKLSPFAVYNITYKTNKGYYDFESAIKDVPVEYMNTGQIITFYGITKEIQEHICEEDDKYDFSDYSKFFHEHHKLNNGDGESSKHSFFDLGWKVYQFNGKKEEWFNRKKWKQFVLRNEDHIDYVPDEEDLEGFNVGEENYIRLKNCEPEEFRSKGRIWLRKNIVPDELSVEEDENGSCDCKYINLLTQSMVDKENTIYMVQYDYTLNNQTLIIPKNSVLYMCGGSINNGYITKSTGSSISAYNAFVISNDGTPVLNTENLIGERIVING